jgi:hypothetical protein
MIMETDVPKDGALPKKLEVRLADYVLDKEPGGVDHDMIIDSGYDYIRDISVPIDGSTIYLYKKSELKDN